MSVNSRPNYSGALYQFASRKRAEGVECKESVKPDTLVLADGVTTYDIVGLDDAKLEELVSIRSFYLTSVAGESHHHVRN
jgi:hypothetical protein